MRAIIHKWRKAGTVLKDPRSDRLTNITPRVHQRDHKRTQNNIKEQQASHVSVKVRVHFSTIERDCAEMKSMGEINEKSTADQKEHRGSSHICEKINQPKLRSAHTHTQVPGSPGYVWRKAMDTIYILQLKASCCSSCLHVRGIHVHLLKSLKLTWCSSLYCFNLYRLYTYDYCFFTTT